MEHTYRDQHQGWAILVASENGWWKFCVVQGEDILSDDRPYQDHLVAIESAKAFIDETVIRGQISALLDDWQEDGRLTGKDLAQFNQLLGRLTQRAIAFRSTVVALQSQQSPKNQSDQADEYPS